MNGVITEAKRDESEKGIVNLEQGMFHRWLIKLRTEAGEEVSADILRKPDSPDPTGETVEQKPNGRWKVAGKGGGGFGGGGQSKDFKADPIKLRGENARSALHAAVALVNADKLPLPELADTARRFYSFIEEKAKVDG